MTGDTLWLIDDSRYGDGALYRRLLRELTLDTLEMGAAFPKNDSLFWAPNLEREYRHRVQAYRASLNDKGQLVLVRLDSLTDDMWGFPKGVYDRTSGPAHP